MATYQNAFLCISFQGTYSVLYISVGRRQQWPQVYYLYSFNPLTANLISTILWDRPADRTAEADRAFGHWQPICMAAQRRQSLPGMYGQPLHFGICTRGTDSR